MIRIGYLDLGHPIDNLNYLATPTPKSCRFLDFGLFALGLDNHKTFIWQTRLVILCDFSCPKPMCESLTL